MAHDEEIEIEPQPPSRAGAGGRLVIAGVVGACALGAGLGLWARPAAHERQFAVAPREETKPEPLPTRMLEIVIDDTPAPIGSLLDVMPAGVGTAGIAKPAPAPVPAQPLAPRPSPTGLMRVDTPAVVIAPPPVVKPMLTVVEPEPPKPVVKPRPKIEAKGDPKPKSDAKVAARKTPKAEPKTAAKSEAKPKKTEKTKLAKAEPKSRKTEKANAQEKKPSRLVRLARAVKEAPAKVEKKIEKRIAKAEPTKESRKAKLARLKAEKAEKKKVDLANAKARKLQLARAETKKPKAAKPAPRGTGPMRVAKVDRCASIDPGEAVVCANASLKSRDRQMQMAYRNAEAAGVPASALRRQQDRWVQARAAAAREAPWAVEDVYQARIAELNDLARDANGAY